MKDKEITNKVTVIIMDTLGLDTHDFGLDRSIEDELGADSIDMVEILSEVEDYFGIDIGLEDEPELIDTAEDLINLIKELGEDI